MKRFINNVLLLIFVMAASVAQAAPRGKAFYHGAENPAHLASIIESALARDKDGTKMISLEKCRADGSCAAPVDYLKVIQERDPEAGLKKPADLVPYLAGFKEDEVHDGKHWMACLRPDRNSPTGYAVLQHCVRRAFGPKEKVWISASSKVEFAQWCTNPLEVPTAIQKKDDPCVEIRFRADHFTAVRFKQYGSTDVSSDACTALKRAGEKDWESPFVEKCPDENCNFQAVDSALGESGWETGSFTPEQQGMNVLRLPAKVAERDSGYRVVFCVDSGDEHSCGVGVQWSDYVPEGNTRVATIYPDGIMALESGTKDALGAPTNLWWHFDSEDCH